MTVAVGRKVLLFALNESRAVRRKPLVQKQQEEITVCKCPHYYEKQGTHENPTARNVLEV